MRMLAFLGDKFPYPFQGFAVTEKKLAENPGQVRRWPRTEIRLLMYMRDNVDGADGIRRYIKALPNGVLVLPSPDAIRTVIEYDVKIPLKIKETIAIEPLMNLKLVEEVRKDLEAKRG